MLDFIAHSSRSRRAGLAHVPMYRTLLVIGILVLNALGFTAPASATGSAAPDAPDDFTFPLNETFMGTSAPGWVLGGTAVLTSGNGDPAGNGWLRLTTSVNPNGVYQAGYAYYNTAIPTGRGLVIQFDYGAWGGSGADGLSFFLFDGATTTFNVGAPGGSLGYAQSSGIVGLSNGYLGLGLDEFGNYSNPNQSRVGGPGLTPEAVAIRGPGSGMTNYVYQAGTTNLTKTPWSLPKLDCPKNYTGFTNIGVTNGVCGSSGTVRPAAATYYRQVQIIVTPVGSAYQVTVAMKFGPSDTFRTLFGPFTMTTSAPGTLKMGFAASTGGSTNYHEIRNLTVNQQVPDLTATKSVQDVNGGNLVPGDELLYTVVLQNQTTTAITGVHFNDPIPAKTTYKTGSVSAPAGSTVNTTSPLDITGITVPASGQATITFRVTLDSSGFTSGDIINNQGTVYWSGDAISVKTDGDTATSGEQATTITVVTSGPNFDTMTKTVSWSDVDSSGGVSAGDILTYQVVIPNTGDQNASNNQFLDVLPTNTTYKSGTATIVSGGGTISYNSSLKRIEWTGTINKTASVTLSFQVTVNSGVQIRDLISNQGTLNYASSGSGTLNATMLTDADTTQPGRQPTQTLVGGKAVLTASKTAVDLNGGTLSPGDTLEYTVVIQNSSPFGVTGATFTDNIPANTSYVGGSASTTSGTIAGTSPTLSVTGIAAPVNSSVTIKFQVTIASSGGFTQVSNQGSVAYDSNNSGSNDTTVLTDSDPTTEGSQATVNAVDQNTDAAIQKSHSGTFAIGTGTGSYTIIVSNVGTGAINGTVTVNDTLPTGLSYNSASGTGWSCGVVDQAVTCTHADGGGGLAAGASLPNITLTVNVLNTAAPGVTNTATVSIVGTDTNTSNNSASDATVIDSADLAVTKSVVPTTVTQVGDKPSFNVQVTNNGPSTATGIEITDLLPGGLAFDSYTASQGTYNDGTGVWSVGSLSSGSSANLSIVATVSSISCGSTIDNTASRTVSSPYDYAPSNDSASATLTLGGSVVLSGAVTEAGNGAAIVDADVQLTDHESHVCSTTTGAGGAYSFTSCDGNPIALGSATLVVSKPDDTWGPVYQTKTVYPGISTCGANTQNVALDTSNLLVTKSDGKSSAAADEYLDYTVAVENIGTIAASGVQVVDTLNPNLLIYLSDTSGLTPAVTIVDSNTTKRTYTLTSDIAANDTFSFVVHTQVKKPLPEGTTQVWNKANASTTSPEADITNNEFTDYDTVSAAPDLKVTLTDNTTSVQAGQTGLTYNLTYQNAGNAEATDVTVVDTLPANVTYVTDSCSPACTYSATNGTLTWEIGTLAVGSPATLSFNVNVNTDATPGTVVANSAAITGGGGTDPDQSNNTAYDSDVVVRPNIEVEKSISSADTPPNWDAQLTFTLNYANRGPVDASNVVITDPLPAGTTFSSADTGCTESGGTVTCAIGTVAAGAEVASKQIVVTLAQHASSATQTGATLTAESASGSVVTTSSVSSSDVKLKWTDTDPTMTAGWNANPRMTSFNDSTWSAPASDPEQEYYWTDEARINAQWLANTDDDEHAYGNYTFFRQKFCVPLNATGLSGTLEVANDDYGDQYVNQVYLGTKVGAGTILTYDASTGIQPGGNLYAVRLLNNTHGGHALYGNKDHVGLVYRLTASYTGLAPFAAAPSEAVASSEAGANIAFQMVPAVLGGVGSFQYQIDFGDGTTQEWTSSTTINHTYAAAGFYAASYTAVVTAKDEWGCTATDQVSVSVLPPERNLLANTATVAYHNGYSVDYGGPSDASAQAATGTPLLSLVDLGVTKTSTPAALYAGSYIVYTIQVSNAGDNSINQVLINDTLPSAIQNPTYQVGKGEFNATTGVWTGTLGKSDSFDLVIMARIDPEAAAGALSNTVTVSPVEGTETSDTDNSATDSKTISAPLAVTLASFTGRQVAEGVLLHWETVSEQDNAGFNLYRADTATGPWTKLNATLIPSAAPGAGGGQVYNWTDTTAAPNPHYYYSLESVDLGGATQMLGAIYVTTMEDRRFWLPLITR